MYVCRWSVYVYLHSYCSAIFLLFCSVCSVLFYRYDIGIRVLAIVIAVLYFCYSVLYVLFCSHMLITTVCLCFIMLSKFNGHNYAEFYPFVCIMLCSSVNKLLLLLLDITLHGGLSCTTEFILPSADP